MTCVWCGKVLTRTGKGHRRGCYAAVRRFNVDGCGDGGTFTFEELVAANVEADPSIAEQLDSLKTVGDSLAYGGGAAAAFTITRVA